MLQPINVSKIPGQVTNSADSDHMPRSATSDLGLHCLLRHFCLMATRLGLYPFNTDIYI